MVSQTESKLFLRSSHCYFPTHNRLHFTGAWNDLSAMYNKLCNPLIEHRAGHCVCAPLPSDECNQNCSEYLLMPYHPAFGKAPPLQDTTLLRPAELCSFPSVPSASKQPLCETTKAAWKNWAGKLFDEKRKLFPNEIFATKCPISSLTIEVVGNFHLKIFPMETRFSPFLSTPPHLLLPSKNYMCAEQT